MRVFVLVLVGGLLGCDPSAAQQTNLKNCEVICRANGAAHYTMAPSGEFGARECVCIHKITKQDAERPQ